MRRTLILPLTVLVLTASLATPSHADRIDSPSAGPAAEAPREFAKPVSPSRAAVKQMVLQRRRLQMERLRHYRMRGLFPRNTYANKILRVLVDKDGRFCAVANMIALDGQRLLVLETAKKNRFVNFADLERGPLVDWVATSGITMQEIAAIQLPDSPVFDDSVVIAKPVEPMVTQVERERKRLVKHLLGVERLLVAQGHKSVETITTRIMNNPALLAQLVRSMRHTNRQPI